MGSCDIVLEMHHPSRGGSIMTDGRPQGGRKLVRYPRRYLEPTFVGLLCAHAQSGRVTLHQATG
jgi:hypothetical protein